MTSARQHLARWGEDKAAAWYEERDWEVLERNWRCASGEIDLVLRRGGVVVFCEVKTRSTQALGTAAEAVGWRKQRKLRSLATQWLAQSPVGVPEVRFDVACVSGGRIEVLEGAF